MSEFTVQVLITIASSGDLQFLTHDLILNFVFPIKATINIGLSYNILSAKLKNSKSSFTSKSNSFFKPEEKHCVLNHSAKVLKYTDAPGFRNYFFTVRYSLWLFSVPPEITALN